MKHCNKIFDLFLVLLTALIVLSGCDSSKNAQQGGAEKTSDSRVFRVGVTQIVSHPGLNQIYEGVQQELHDLGYASGKDIQLIFRNANGDPSLVGQIASEFSQANLDLIIPITTPSTLAVFRAVRGVPIVFAGVTDPVGVKLVQSLQRPGGNVTGTSDRWPIKEQYTLFKSVFPKANVIGMLYKPGDDISAIALGEMETLAKEFRFELITAPVSSAQDIYPVSLKLLQTADAIYTGMDNLIVENVDSVIKAANEAGKPVFAGDEGSVQKGAVLASAVDMFNLGKQTARLADKVLKGKKPGELPVVTLNSGKLVANKEALTKLGLDPEKVREETGATFSPSNK